MRLSEPVRCFLALWPDPALARALADLADALARGGRPVRASRIHLTLLFAGSVDEACLTGLMAAGEQLARQTAPFDIALDRLVWWAGSRVLTAQPGAPGASLATLGEACRTAGEALGLTSDPRPFAPHVTLVRGGQHADTVMPHAQVFRWRAADLRLVESLRDGAGTYRECGRWRLGGG